jgi:hypothetical protein
LDAAEWETAEVDALMRSVPKDNRKKLRLLACACCRSVWPLLTEAQSRRAVKVAERFAMGSATEQELNEARRAARSLPSEAARAAVEAAKWERGLVASIKTGEVARLAASAARTAASRAAPRPEAAAAARSAWAAERRKQADLVRCIFCNPHRPMPRFDRAWLRWGGGTVKRVAEAIRQERAYDRMPVLADALEESGCTDTQVLTHCRIPHHALGCWVLNGLCP